MYGLDLLLQLGEVALGVLQQFLCGDELLPQLDFLDGSLRLQLGGVALGILQQLLCGNELFL